MSIAHKYGSTEITAEPQRVVLVGLNEQDAMLALGEVPVATSNFLDASNGIFPRAEARFAQERATHPEFAGRSAVTATFSVGYYVDGADDPRRTVIAPGQLPAGLLAALVGTPYFVWLLWRSRSAT